MDFCKKYHRNKIDIIEIHNRPEYLSHIKEYFPKTKIILYFHNNPLTMRFSSSINEREFIINNTGDKKYKIISIVIILVMFWPIMSTGSLIKNWNGVLSFYIIGICISLNRVRINN